VNEPNNDPASKEDVIDGGQSPDIFVSYRVRPDEDLAGELRTLLEGAIDPRPQVFVSGLGGLRASARSARAYVGLITKASVDREWIYFEAGAAFGRNVLYAPLLVDLAAIELPSSIGGYQGTAATDQARMHEFVEDLAKAIGAEVKPHFGQRFSRFAKAVEAYRKAPSEELSGLPLAIHLIEVGKRDEGQALFDELENAESRAERKANIRVTKLYFLHKDRTDRLSLLEQQPREIQETATFKLWLGVNETNPVRAVQLLREAYDGNLEGFHQRWALESLARNEFELGHKRAATSRLLQALASGDRYLRALAAAQLAEHLGESDEILKLLLVTESTLDGAFESLSRAARYCWTKGYTNIGLHLAMQCVTNRSNDESHLYRGLLRNQANCRSLAFEDYRVAAQRGASVAKSNMASLLNGGPVAEAGLDILRTHPGNYNSQDPGSPYEIRAVLERSVDAERAQERTRTAHGQRLAKAIHRLLDTWRRRQQGFTGSGQWIARAASGTWELVVQDGTVRVSRNAEPLILRELGPLSGFFVGFLGPVAKILLVLGHIPESVVFDGFAETGAVEWLETVPAPPREESERPLTVNDGIERLALPGPEEEGPSA
jgi:hypothetical protein